MKSVVAQTFMNRTVPLMESFKKLWSVINNNDLLQTDPFMGSLFFDHEE